MRWPCPSVRVVVHAVLLDEAMHAGSTMYVSVAVEREFQFYTKY